MNSDLTVESKLRATWRKERRVCHLRGLSHLLIWAVSLTVTDLAVDWLFLVPGWGRAALLAADLAILAAVFRRQWWLRLRRYDAVRVALQVERRHPELGSLLVSYVQIGDDATARTGASPALVAALRRQALDLTGPVNFREIVTFRELRRVGIACAGIVLCFAGVNIRWSQHFRVLALRMFNPGSTIRYPTRTTITSLTGPLIVQQGRDVTIAAKTGGFIPAHGRLLVRPSKGPWETIRLDAAPSGEFSRTFPQAYRSFEYRFALGDAETEILPVTVVPAPRIEKTTVAVHCPAYTGLKDQTVAELNIDAPEGAEIEWQLRLSRRLAKAEVAVFEEMAAGEGAAATGTTAVLALDASGLTARWHSTAAGSVQYRFTWTDAAHPFVYAEEVTYAIRSIPDREPEVEIVSPGPDEMGTVRKKLDIEFAAKDDYGIAEAAVELSLNDGAAVRIPVKLAPAREVKQSFSLGLAAEFPALKAGDRIAYTVEVADNRDSGKGPQRVKASPHHLEIVSVEDYLAYLLKRSAEAYGEIGFMRDQEDEAKKAIGEIKQNSGQ